MSTNGKPYKAELDLKVPSAQLFCSVGRTRHYAPKLRLPGTVTPPRDGTRRKVITNAWIERLHTV